MAKRRASRTTISRSRKFRLAVGAAFLAGMSYPIAVFLGNQGWEDSRRWIHNDPGFTVFLPLILPFAFGVFVANVDLKPLERLSRAKRSLILGVLVLLVALALMVSVVDLNGQVSSPVRYKNAVEVLKHETALRQRVKDKVDEVRKASTEKVRAAKALILATTIHDVRDEYLSKWPRINSLSALVEVGAPAAWVAFILNVLAALFAATFFWYCWVLVQFRRDWTATQYDWLLLAVGLWMGWFPLRLYSEWYLNFYSMQGMASYGVFGLLVGVAVLAYLFVAFRVASRLNVKIFATVATALIGVVTTIGRLAPEWLEGIAWVVEGWDFRLYVVLLLLTALALSSMVWSLLELGAANAAEARPRTRRRASG